MDIPNITFPISNLHVTDETFIQSFSGNMVNFWYELASISYATQALFLGSVSLGFSPAGTSYSDTRVAGQPSFLETPFGSGPVDAMQFVWGAGIAGNLIYH
jgi:hypothetical protein